MVLPKPGSAFLWRLQWCLGRAIVSLWINGSQAVTRTLNVVTLPLPFGPALPRPGRPYTAGGGATLFEALARADAGNGGLGLGLSICRGIARAHGGDLTWEDREGGGTIFRVRLPGAAVEAYAEQEER